MATRNPFKLSLVCAMICDSNFMIPKRFGIRFFDDARQLWLAHIATTIRVNAYGWDDDPCSARARNAIYFPYRAAGVMGKHFPICDSCSSRELRNADQVASTRNMAERAISTA
jgi:hypothetical protein